MFSYIGPLEIDISPKKYLIVLEFNGNIFVPIELVIFDQTLQCLFNNLAQKCSKLASLSYGYFKSDGSVKSKQIVLRNWNP